LGRSGEPDLVVYYYVDYSAHFECFQVLHLQSFVDYSLSCERSVTVHQYSDCPIKVIVSNALNN
jgi:hypothetical protein